AAADSGGRALRQHHAFLDQIVEGIERRLAVAGMRQRAGMTARIVAPTRRIGDERRQKPHQRPPFLHGAAEMVRPILARPLRTEPRGAGVEQDRAADGAHGRSDRRAGLQGRFFDHTQYCDRWVKGWLGPKGVKEPSMAKYRPRRTSLME